MKCKVCGTVNEDYLEYCENCAAPLSPDTPTDDTAADNAASSSAHATADEIYESRKGWSFVKAPSWPKPEFDANTVSEDDIPADFVPSTKKSPSLTNEVDHGYTQPTSAPKTEVSPSFKFTPPESTPLDSDIQDEARPLSSVRRPLSSVQKPQYNEQQPIISEPVMKEHKSIPSDSAFEQDRQIIKSATGDEFEPDEYDRDYDNDDDDGETLASKRRAATRTGSRSSSRPPKAPRSGRRGSSNKGLFIAAAGALVVLIVVFLAIIIGNNYGGDWGRFFNYTFGAYPMRRPATIETTTLNEHPARLITVYAKNGYKARFKSNSVDQTAEVSEGLIQFRVADQVWIPDSPVDSATLEITPDITLIAPDGAETPVEFSDKVILQLPSLDLTITTPAIAEIPTDSSFIDFVGIIADTTASVFLNDTPVQFDESGNFTARYSELVQGENTIHVEARKNGYQINRKTFTVICGASTTPIGPDSTPVPGNITFAFDSGEGKFRTTGDSITVTGTMESGALIAVSGVTLVGEVTQDAAAGTFSFTVSTPSVQVYSVNVTATKDGTALTKPLYLERSHSDKDAYMGAALTQLDYNKLKNYPTHEQSYVLKYKIAEVIQSEPYFKLRVTTSAGDVIVCYYNNLFTSSEFTAGSTFKFYGDPHGTDVATGLPMIHAWYIKKSSD